MGRRCIGIKHRVKATVEGKARPTLLAIHEGGKIKTFELADETAELDLVRGQFPIQYRKLENGDSLEGIPPHQIEYRKLKEGEKSEDFPQDWLKTDGKAVSVASKVPCEWLTLTKGDTIAMPLGGSGDRLLYALARVGEEQGFEVMSISSFKLRDHRLRAAGEDGITYAELIAGDDDAITLAELVSSQIEEFYTVTPRSLAIIALREAYRARKDVVRDRMACAQRRLQQLTGKIFLSPDGKFPEGTLEQIYDEIKANDKILNALMQEELTGNKDLNKACEGLDIYRELFKNIEQMGPAISGRIISSIVDIKRFIVEPDEAKMTELYEASRKLEAQANFNRDKDRVANLVTAETNQYELIGLVRDWKRANGHEDEAKLLDEALELHRQRAILRRNAKQKGKAKFKAYCGVHVLTDGRFPRRRNGERANWSGDCRQAMYLFGEQINRAPNCFWGKKLRENKAKLRLAHPEPIKVTKEVTENKKKVTKTVTMYSDGHIHRMAVWKTLSKFAEWLYTEWVKLETAKPKAHKAKN